MTDKENDDAVEIAKKLSRALGLDIGGIELSADLLRGVSVFTASVYSMYIDTYKSKGATAVLHAHMGLAQSVSDDIKANKISGMSVEVGSVEVAEDDPVA